MAIVLDESSFIALLALLAFVGITINQQGGIRIVLWRIRGQKWFMRVEKQPDGSAIRKAYKWKGRVQEHSQPRYEHNGKDWFVGGPTETVRVFGGPQWVYNYNDARPLPLEHIKFQMVETEEKIKDPDQAVDQMIEETVKDENGNDKIIKRIVKKTVPGIERTLKKMVPVIIAGKPIDPMLIHAAFQNKSIEAFNKLGDKPNKFRWGLLGFVIAVIFIITAFNLLYTYYYGVNIACAVHAQGVQCH